MQAGYKGSETTLANMAAQNYRKPYIRQEIDRRKAELKAENKEKLEITHTLCTQRFNDIYWHCISTGDNAGALRAIENHAKHQGYYEKDNAQRQAQLQAAIKNEQTIIAKGVEEAKVLTQALDQAPDAMAD